MPLDHEGSMSFVRGCSPGRDPVFDPTTIALVRESCSRLPSDQSADPRDLPRTVLDRAEHQGHVRSDMTGGRTAAARPARSCAR